MPYNKLAWLDNVNGITDIPCVEDNFISSYLKIERVQVDVSDKVEILFFEKREGREIFHFFKKLSLFFLS